MNLQTAGRLVIFGIFTALLGVIGYLTHPDKAATSLILGGGAGALLVLCGILGARELRWSKPAAVFTALLLSATGVWRASWGWLAVVNGQSEKVFASVIITLMLTVALFMLVFLLKDRKAGGVADPNGGAR